MSLTLHACDLGDIPQLTEIYMAAFKDAISLRCFPRSGEVIAWWTCSNETDFRNQPSARFLKVTDREGKIVAYGKWNVPTEVGDEIINGGDNPDEMPSWPKDGDQALSEEFFGSLARRRQEIMGLEPHYYLEIVATLPENQRRGAAGMIIKWGLKRADEEGRRAYIEAGPGLVEIYERYGWKVKDRFRPSLLGGYEECMMVRDARKS